MIVYDVMTSLLSTTMKNLIVFLKIRFKWEGGGFLETLVKIENQED